MINVFQPMLGELELKAIRKVVNSNWLGPGPKVEAFKSRFAEYINALPSELVPLTSCTEGLFQSLAVLNLNSNDEVILPTISFVGAAHAVRYSGARIVFCDVDAHTLNAREEHVLASLSSRTKAILLLHYGGHPGSIRETSKMAQERGIILIEDAACAIGSSVDNCMAGTFGDLGLWSFDPMKILVTGDGGMVRCRLAKIVERIQLNSFLGLKSTGIERSRENVPWWEIEPEWPGRRARMNDLTAAIGLIQLRRLPQFLKRREQIAIHYNAGLRGIRWLRRPPFPGKGEKSSWYFYWIQVSPAVRDKLAQHLLTKGVYTTFRYWPLHKTRMYARPAASFPGAEYASASTLLLPLHQSLSDNDVDQVIDAVKQFKSTSWR
jgi:aminotransferase